MPAIAALSINDGQASPAAHSFAPVTTNGSKSEWADCSSTTAAGWRVLSNEARKPASATAAVRNLTNFYLPVEATVDGSVKVVRFNSAKVEFNFSQEATDQEKKDAVAYMANVLGNATFKAALIANEPHY